MNIRVLVLFGLAVFLFSLILPAQTRPGGLVEGKIWFWDAMANSPGICVTNVDRYVVDYRVECTQPGWETVIWQGLPQPGDYIDTLGANWVKMQAFYSFPPGVQDLAGIGVHTKHAEYPPDWSHIERTRKTNTIRVQNPDWDFTFRNSGRSFAPCLRRAQEANYLVTGPWGGPRYDRAGGGCEAVEGAWKWFNGGKVVLDGKGGVQGCPQGSDRFTNPGTWKCVNGSPVTIQIIWVNGGWIDTLTLAAGGRRLEGRNQQNSRVWAER